MIPPLARLRSARLAGPIARAGAWYADERSPDEIASLQLDAFNRVWSDTIERSDYFRFLAAERGLPVRFTSWDEFTECVPLLDRRTLAREVERFVVAGSRPDYHRVTGGSTAQPISIPASHSEDRANLGNTWLARSWYGVVPSDRLFLLWGHSHLLGFGASGAVKRWLRAAKDRSIGYLRVSAYDLSDHAMRIAARRLLAHKPAYVIGYSAALHRLAHVNRDLRDRFRSLAIKVAIATAESFPSAHSAELISETFGCPVAMEYGAVETGLIAHEHPHGGLRVFWASHYVEAVPSTNRPECQEIAVTALYPRMVPLIRYRLGDLVRASDSIRGRSATLDAVIGRCNDEILLGDSTRIHSEAFSHVLRDVCEVQAFQVVQEQPQAVSINYLSDDHLPETTLSSIRRRLIAIDERLRGTRLVRVDRLEETIAGKTKRVVNRLHPGIHQ